MAYHSPTNWKAGSEIESRKGLRRSEWLLLPLGLILGLAVGLVYTWGLNPVRFYNTDPVDLRPVHKERWVNLAAVAYHLDGDQSRVMSRLAGLNDPQIGRTVAAMVEDYVPSGQPDTQICALAALADVLGVHTDVGVICLTGPEPPIATVAPLPTPTNTVGAIPTSFTPVLSVTDTLSPAENPTGTSTTLAPSATLVPIHTPTNTPRPVLVTPTDTPPAVTAQPTPVPVDTSTDTPPAVTAQPTPVPVDTPTDTPPAATGQPPTAVVSTGIPIFTLEPIITLLPPIIGGTPEVP